MRQYTIILHCAHVGYSMYNVCILYIVRYKSCIVNISYHVLYILYYLHTVFVKCVYFVGSIHCIFVYFVYTAAEKNYETI